jgi:hypothetical protein
MAAHEHTLSAVPKDKRARELWIQHAAGFILFEDARGYARQRIDPHLAPDVRAAVEKGIDDALYGLMMIVDGVSGSLSSASNEVHVALLVRHMQKQKNGDSELVEEVDLAYGDGMCMGMAGWLEGDFGEPPPVKRAAPKRAKKTAKVRRAPKQKAARSKSRRG